MFCNRCGTEVQAGSVVCSKCGRKFGDPVAGVIQSRLERHLRTLAILWMITGGLFVVPAVGFMVFGRSVQFMVHEQQPWPEVFQLLVFLAGSTLLILAAGGVCVGLGLMQKALWARTAAIVLGVLALFHPPLGTALGVYSLWVLVGDEGGDQYRYLAQAQAS